MLMVCEPTPAPDPVFAAIARAQLASDAYVSVFDRDDGSAAFERCRDALCDGAAESWRALLTVTPTTLAGSAALARLALALASQGREEAYREALEVLSRTGVATTAAAPTPAMRSGPPRRPPAALAPRPARLPSPGLSPEAPPPRPSDR